MSHADAAEPRGQAYPVARLPSRAQGQQLQPHTYARWLSMESMMDMMPRSVAEPPLPMSSIKTMDFDSLWERTHPRIDHSKFLSALRPLPGNSDADWGQQALPQAQHHRWPSTGHQRVTNYQPVAASVSEPPAGSLTYAPAQATATTQPAEVLALPAPPTRPATPLTTRRPPARVSSSSSLLSHRSTESGRMGVGGVAHNTGIDHTNGLRQWGTTRGGSLLDRPMLSSRRAGGSAHATPLPPPATPRPAETRAGGDVQSAREAATAAGTGGDRRAGLMGDHQGRGVTEGRVTDVSRGTSRAPSRRSSFMDHGPRQQLAAH